MNNILHRAEKDAQIGNDSKWLISRAREFRDNNFRTPNAGHSNFHTHIRSHAHYQLKITIS